MEAMTDTPRDARVVVVETVVSAEGVLQVSVRDAGTGLAEGIADLVFEPFYTTKKTGMGMGLSISRSIVEAHGGHIWASTNGARGATFSFTLPLSGSRRA
jgi:signal transduction histidine kinase